MASLFSFPCDIVPLKRERRLGDGGGGEVLVVAVIQCGIVVRIECGEFGW